jgi:hypothetical protein
MQQRSITEVLCIEPSSLQLQRDSWASWLSVMQDPWEDLPLERDQPMHQAHHYQQRSRPTMLVHTFGTQRSAATAAGRLEA